MGVDCLCPAEGSNSKIIWILDLVSNFAAMIPLSPPVLKCECFVGRAMALYCKGGKSGFVLVYRHTN